MSLAYEMLTIDVGESRVVSALRIVGNLRFSGLALFEHDIFTASDSRILTFVNPKFTSLSTLFYSN